MTIRVTGNRGDGLIMPEGTGPKKDMTDTRL